jgi:hypothetical protein
MARPGSLAKIVYRDGCVVDVYPGAVVAIKDREECRKAGFLPSMLPFAVSAGIIGGAFAINIDHDHNRPQCP